MEKESCQSHKSVMLITEWSCYSHMIGNIRTMGDEVHSHNSSCIYSIYHKWSLTIRGLLIGNP